MLTLPQADKPAGRYEEALNSQIKQITPVIASDAFVNNFLRPGAAPGTQPAELQTAIAKGFSDALVTNTGDIKDALDTPYYGGAKTKKSIGEKLVKAYNDFLNLDRVAVAEKVAESIAQNQPLFDEYKRQNGAAGVPLTDQAAKEKLKNDLSNDAIFQQCLRDLKNQHDLMLRQRFAEVTAKGERAQKAATDLVQSFSGSDAVNLFVGTKPKLKEGDYERDVGIFIKGTKMQISKGKDGSLKATLSSPYGEGPFRLLDLAAADGGTDNGEQVTINLGSSGAKGRKQSPSTNLWLNNKAQAILEKATGMGAYKGNRSLAEIEANYLQTGTIDPEAMSAYKENIRTWGGKSLNVKVADFFPTAQQESRIEYLKDLHKLMEKIYTAEADKNLARSPQYRQQADFRPDRWVAAPAAPVPPAPPGPPRAGMGRI